MRVVIQRVRSARVEVAGERVGEIEAGLVVLLGVARDDRESDAEWLAEKTAGLRIFEDGDAKMNLSVRDVGGSILAVSQFTLLGDCRKGRRPSFVEAAPPDIAEPLFDHFVQKLRSLGLPTATGRFGNHMEVSLVNDGPVTIVLDSHRLE